MEESQTALPAGGTPARGSCYGPLPGATDVKRVRPIGAVALLLATAVLGSRTAGAQGAPADEPMRLAFVPPPVSSDRPPPTVEVVVPPPPISPSPVRPTAPPAAPYDPAYRRGPLLMPFVGVHLPLGAASTAFDLGFRVGGILGHHVLPFLSLNGELTFDVLNGNEISAADHQSAHTVDLTFSPLFHFPTERGTIVLGPRVGGFSHAVSLVDFTNTPDGALNAHGLAYGLNAGLFGGIRDVAVGLLIGYTNRHATETCSTPRNSPEVCASGGTPFQVLSITAAVLL